MSARRRPWRAVAFKPDPTAPNGRKREVTGRTAACTPDGLNGFIRRQTLAGNVVDTLKVLELEYDNPTEENGTMTNG